MGKIEKEIEKAFVKNAIEEMRKRGRDAFDYARKLEQTGLDVEQDALISNFEREFNHKFGEVLIKK